MTGIIHCQGDLFTTTARAIAHGVNVDGRMGAGIALPIRNKFPKMFSEYRLYCVTDVLQPGHTHTWTDGQTVIYNCASQDRPGPYASLDWLDTSVREALTDADTRGIERIAMPRIGCGIGGLHWEDVEPLLFAAAADHRCDLEVWTLSA